MLLRFTFSNHRSFRDEQELSLVASSFGDHPEVVLHSAGLTEGVLPVAAIYGANASGKTNVIRALQFMAMAVRASQRHWQPDGPIPREPFAGAEESIRGPSRFALDFAIEGIRHQYGFIVDSVAVLEEWLHVYPKGKKQVWFTRVRGNPMSFSAKMLGENRAIENLTRPNSLFLSAAAQNNHAALMPIYQWFSGSMSFIIGDRGHWMIRTAELYEKLEQKKIISEMIAAADLGVEDLHVQRIEVTEETKQLLEAVSSIFKHPAPEKLLEARPEVQLLHRLEDSSVPFAAEQESEGTKAYLALLGPIIQALTTGGTICIDELDASLHPLLALQLMSLFNASSRNPKEAQLIFTTHDTNLLNSGILRRDQVWFTEKKKDASSYLYPLSDFKPRRHENLENGYLQGRYGAIPFINSDSFVGKFGEDLEKT